MAVKNNYSDVIVVPYESLVAVIRIIDYVIQLINQNRDVETHSKYILCFDVLVYASWQHGSMQVYNIAKWPRLKSLMFRILS